MSTILIVDDAASARETLLAMLEPENYQLHLAEDGFQALQMLATLQPDLILLDVMMPGLDGFEVCRRIRSTPKLAEVPIIILTALDDRASLLQGIEAVSTLEHVGNLVVADDGRVMLPPDAYGELAQQG